MLLLWARLCDGDGTWKRDIIGLSRVHIKKDPSSSIWQWTRTVVCIIFLFSFQWIKSQFFLAHCAHYVMRFDKELLMSSVTRFVGWEGIVVFVDESSSLSRLFMLLEIDYLGFLKTIVYLKNMSYKNFSKHRIHLCLNV